MRRESKPMGQRYEECQRIWERLLPVCSVMLKDIYVIVPLEYVMLAFLNRVTEFEADNTIVSVEPSVL